MKWWNPFKMLGLPVVEGEPRLTRLLGQTCAECNEPTAEHSVSFLGSVPVSRDEAGTDRLLGLGESGQWDSIVSLSRLSPDDPDANYLEWYAIKCRSGTIRITTIVAVADLFGRDFMHSVRTVHSEDELKAIEAISVSKDGDWSPDERK